MSAAALILAAGEGTRMKSALPKVAHPVLGVPMVRLVVDAARTAGIERVVAVVGHRADVVEAILEGETCVLQERQLGTGHAVMSAKESLEGLEGSLVVLAGDTPLITPETIRELIERREESGAAASVLTMRVEDPSGYGRIVRDSEGAVADIVEQTDLAPDQLGIDEVNTSTYCFDGEALLSRVEQLSADNAQGEFYLTDMIALLHDEGLGVVGVLTDDPEEAMGVNSRVQLAEAARVLQRRLNRAHMLEGVTMTAPELVWISPTVRIARDVTIGPMTFIEGETVIEEGAHVGPNCRIVDSRIAAGARVDSSVLVEADVGPAANVGPLAYLRPGATLLERSKAGTFVEIKNSTVGPGSKVPHLSYVGDARIGRSVNVGAGTITCNYDGMAKHSTEIGDEAFIGSSTMLVAPVRVGAGAVVGAGSVITHDVPDDALGVGRGRQENFKGWAARWRQRRAQGRD
jgi:bifunctional UDP-N-acetylglucosamine pyrophosphorylase/glucosamine-1-phosphate N-acetyltransferase